MNTIRELVGQELAWVPTEESTSRYTLLAGEVVLATLEMSDRTATARAEAAEGSFTIKREGSFREGVVVQTTEDGPVLATFTKGWRGGMLRFTDGRMYKWGNSNFWRRRKAWMEPSGVPLVELATTFSRRLLVTVTPQAVMIPELSLLAILGLYIVLLTQRDEQTAAAKSYG